MRHIWPMPALACAQEMSVTDEKEAFNSPFMRL